LYIYDNNNNNNNNNNNMVVVDAPHDDPASNLSRLLRVLALAADFFKCA